MSRQISLAATVAATVLAAGATALAVHAAHRATGVSRPEPGPITATVAVVGLNEPEPDTAALPALEVLPIIDTPASATVVLVGHPEYPERPGEAVQAA